MRTVREWIVATLVCSCFLASAFCLMLTAQQPAAGHGEAEAAKTVQADAAFLDAYGQAVALEQTINEIERENGVPKMRERLQKLSTVLQTWAIQHKVQGWRFDPETKTFTEIKKPEPPKPTAAPK